MTVFVFVVGAALDKDALKGGDVLGRMTKLKVAADGFTDARLTAEQIVAT